MQKGFIFDLDGTVYIEDRLIEGAAKAIKDLRDRGDKVVFLTNNSTGTVNYYVERLNKLGVKAVRDDLINSNLLVQRYLNLNLNPDEKVMVIGESPLFNKLSNSNISITDDAKEASYVVVGWDRKFTYDKLNNAYQAWSNGAKILATNPDRTCPVEGGQIPDCGAMIGALEGATGEKIDLILGKPSKLAVEFIVNDILKLPPEQCFMVGDRLETDIKMGNCYGLQSVLVMTGITDEELLAKSVEKPTHVLSSIKEIVNL